MAHFAKLDKENTVTDILFVDNDLIKDDNGVEQESIGIQKLLVGNPNCTFVQTSYNTEANEHRNGGTAFRKNYAMKGGKYDAVRDAFVGERLYPEQTVLDTDTMQWYTPFIGKQSSDNAGNPMPYDDNSDYDTKATVILKDWSWDNKTKTYVGTAITKKVAVNYAFNSTSGKWEEQ
tara:strand:- start:2059 stop:2586 length:528 start_codon:yes stop_codon:yes gene_type:complete